MSGACPTAHRSTVFLYFGICFHKPYMALIFQHENLIKPLTITVKATKNRLMFKIVLIRENDSTIFIVFIKNK